MTNPYPARTHSYIAGDQVNSSDLNAIQDGVIAVGAAHSTLEGRVTTAEDDIDDAEVNIASLEEHRDRRATGNAGDTPIPAAYSGGSVWFEKATDGAGVVMIDDSKDWRDKFIILTAHMTANTLLHPGQANDDSIRAIVVNGNAVGAGSLHAIAYTEQGQTGGATLPGIYTQPNLVGWLGDYILFFARDTDGALCMTKVGSADPDIWFLGKVDYSPDQNHYIL